MLPLPPKSLSQPVPVCHFMPAQRLMEQWGCGISSMLIMARESSIIDPVPRPSPEQKRQKKGPEAATAPKKRIGSALASKSSSEPTKKKQLPSTKTSSGAGERARASQPMGAPGQSLSVPSRSTSGSSSPSRRGLTPQVCRSAMPSSCSIATVRTARANAMLHAPFRVCAS